MACRMGNFLLPPHYAQHKHAWVPVAMGVRLCALCGAEHVCFRGECEEVMNDAGERVCTLSGCVTQCYHWREVTYSLPLVPLLRAGGTALLTGTCGRSGTLTCAQPHPPTRLRRAARRSTPSSSFTIS